MELMVIHLRYLSILTLNCTTLTLLFISSLSLCLRRRMTHQVNTDHIVLSMSRPPLLSCSIQRERDAGSRCVVSMVTSSITIQDPRESQSCRSFCFDYAYWSHSSFARDHSGLYVPEEPGGRYADQVSAEASW